MNLKMLGDWLRRLAVVLSESLEPSHLTFRLNFLTLR
jgi:hypothetical protein